MIVENKFENIRLLHEHTLANRAYYIPASSFMGDLVEDREKSDRFQLLSGSWDFRYYKSIYDLDEEDIFARIRKDADSFVKVEVPGVWQIYGYDCHQYTNFTYPFPMDPPYVPADNPCGIYVRSFEYDREEDAPLVSLNFEGVDSCFYAWLNGTYLGYSQVSHCTSEFDVSRLVCQGKNNLVVLVLKWCDGSYMEDQDKFRMTGIFRDVYLLKRPRRGLFDYRISSRIREDGSADLRIRSIFYRESFPEADLLGQSDADEQDGERPCYQVELFDPDGKTCLASGNLEEDTCLIIPHARLWNPEDPFLYYLVFSGMGETIVERVGIREICIRENVVYLNGHKLLFRGVNRHESDPLLGPVVTLDRMKEDLRLIRRHNLNAIRTSHYPDVPAFYQLCDRYGIMVMDEADNESHGPVANYYKDQAISPEERWNEWISDNPDYIPATLDRVRRMVMRDKNRPCILIWSMGNECGYGCTFEKALSWVKSYDPDRLTHYEGAFHKRKGRKYDYSDLDLYSRMYPSLEEMEAYIRNDPDKPMILCEYSHAMGNGPGDPEDYQELFDAHDILCGGFVWEWCDHAIQGYPSAADHPPVYSYGGDHGEILHDGNFCVDGLVFPHRLPHTGLLELKNVHRPVRASYDREGKVLTLSNRMLFSSLGDCVMVRVVLERDGEVLYSSVLPEEELKLVGPGEKGSLFVNLPLPSDGKCYLKVCYEKKKGDELVPEGMNLGFDEFLLENEDGRNQKLLEYIREYTKNNPWEKCGETVPVNLFRTEETGRTVTFSVNGCHYVYDKLTGMFSAIYKKESDGRRIDLLEESMKISIWRAPTDNDRDLKTEWIRAGYHRTCTRAYETSWQLTDRGLEISGRLGLLADGRQRIMTLRLLWRISGENHLRLEMEAEKDRNFPDLPRFGIRLMAPGEMDRLEYFGLGPMESYIDKHRAASHGLYRARVKALHEDHIRPQENGSHADCDYILLKGKEADLLAFADEPFSFNASVYTEEELTVKAHNHELVPCGSTLLHLDYRQNGIGSASCGPPLRQIYRFNRDRFSFAVEIFFRFPVS